MCIQEKASDKVELSNMNRVGRVTLNRAAEESLVFKKKLVIHRCNPCSLLSIALSINSCRQFLSYSSAANKSAKCYFREKKI